MSDFITLLRAFRADVSVNPVASRALSDRIMHLTGADPAPGIEDIDANLQEASSAVLEAGLSGRIEFPIGSLVFSPQEGLATVVKDDGAVLQVLQGGAVVTFDAVKTISLFHIAGEALEELIECMLENAPSQDSRAEAESMARVAVGLSSCVRNSSQSTTDRATLAEWKKELATHLQDRGVLSETEVDVFMDRVFSAADA